eukprot:COSAG02_NODE_3405_length_6797_cov_2.630188_5_plen_71_part_00
MLASLTGHSSSINWNVRQIYNHLLFLSRTGCLWFQWQPWRRVTMSTSNSGGAQQRMGPWTPPFHIRCVLV